MVSVLPLWTPNPAGTLVRNLELQKRVATDQGKPENQFYLVLSWYHGTSIGPLGRELNQSPQYPKIVSAHVDACTLDMQRARTTHLTRNPLTAQIQYPGGSHTSKEHPTSCSACSVFLPQLQNRCEEQEQHFILSVIWPGSFVF